MKPPHYRYRYHVDSRRVRQHANANPDQRCWRCGRTLGDHPPHKNGKPPHWQAGHVVDGEPGGTLLPEASTCNTSEGGKLRHKRNTRTDLTW